MCMKWLITYCMICIFSAITAQPYLNSTSTWTEHYGVCGFTGSCDYYDYMRTIFGDTVINGLTYHRIATSGIHSVYDLSEGQITLTEPFTWENQFIREEQSQLYWYRSNNGSEVLLADFDLLVGDTAVGTYCQSTLIVDHIDTVYLDNEPRRRYWFGPGNNHHNYLVEGVGASAGLFENPCSEIGIEAGGSMECFGQDDGLIVIDSSAACNTTTATSDVVKFKGVLEVYPNPASDFVNMTFDDRDVAGSVTIRIYNVQGKVVLTQVFSPAETLDLDIATIIPGMYTITVQQHDGMLVGRIVKGVD